MWGFIGKIIFGKLFGKSDANKQTADDPYFEYVPTEDLRKNPNAKFKKRKKPLPEGLSSNDAKVLATVRRRAYRLDNNINICGIKFGWSSIFGLVPGLGDGLDLALAWMVYKTCEKIDGGLPDKLKWRMWHNIAIDFIVGLVPLVGDLADAMFRANTRNAVLLTEYLDKKYNPRNGNRNGRSGHRTEDIEMAQPRRNDIMPDPERRERQDRGTRGDQNDRGPRKPDRAAASQSRRNGGWYSGRGSQRERDLERGEEPEYEYHPAQPPRPR